MKKIVSFAMNLLAPLIIIIIHAESHAKDKCITTVCHSKIKKHKYLHGPLTVDDCIVCKKGNVANHPDQPGNEFVPEKQGEKGLCFSCHLISWPESNYESVHDSLDKKDCMVCHDHHGSEHKFLLHRSKDNLCSFCHENEKHSNITSKKLVETKNSECLECHVAHVYKGKDHLLHRNK